MTSGPARTSASDAWPWLLIPLLAFLLVLPLLLIGPSCGHDFGFHMQSWMDSSAQMRQGTLFPHWAYSPAFNAGEPRFLFYPPLSWLLGSVLMLVLPASVVPAAFTFCCFALAGIGMLALARRYASDAGALLATTLYLINPYLLFTAYTRTAYAELLAAAWLPWLLRAALAEETRILPIAWPLALLWLTNAPAAVMGTYALASLLLLRLLQNTRGHVQRRTGTLGLDLPLLGAGAGGLLLGLALAGFYLVPAAYERRFVQISMAIIPNMRVEDNFLFGHTGYGPHDVVLHKASVVAVSVIVLTLLAFAFAWFRVHSKDTTARSVWWAALLLAGAICILQRPLTLPLWHHLPELAFLQFPWRWMSVLGCLFALACAMAVGQMRMPAPVVAIVAVVLAGIAAPLALRPFREACDVHELPAERVALFQSRHGVGPTDEYTPGDADNDQLRWDEPAWWLAANPNAPGPDTVPNPAATITNYDEPPPLSQTVSGRAPMHLTLNTPQPENVILNLRAYPAWAVTVNGRAAQPLDRDDGLLAVAIPAGHDQVDVRWHRLPDMWLGEGLSFAALLVAGGIVFRRVESKPKA